MLSVSDEHEPTPDPNEEPLAEELDEEPKVEGPLDSATTTSLAQAILLMTSELRRRENPSRKAKAKEPDTFDGSEPKKLNNFILLCNLYFRSNPAYEDDTNKVTLALSYLRGTALEYFEPSILDSDEYPDWMDNWSAFVRNLRTQFGPIDPTADAEDGIDNLKMQDNQKIVKYNVEFNKLAIRTHWDDGVLRHRYYSGLAERIKDIMGQQGKPSTLEEMKTLAHSIDSRYWERLREKSRAGRSKSDNSDKPDSNKGKSDDKKNQASTSGHNHNKDKPKKQQGNNQSDNKSDKPQSSSGKANTISDKLGKDGKLLPAERQRRFDNNLCMFCGGPGHTAANCNKSTSSASKAKGRAAQTKEKEKEATSDSKKG
jgi:Retrotransposon gag protein